MIKGLIAGLIIPNLALCFLLVVTLPGDCSEYIIKERNVPEQYQDEFEFLELIKWPQEPDGAFDASKAPRWNLTEVMAHISQDGVNFTDANGIAVGHVSKAEILEQLDKRDGQVFRSFAHLSHIYSIPYKQYSELSFKDAGNETIVDIGGWYRLVFKAVDGLTFLAGVDYLTLEGD